MDLGLKDRIAIVTGGGRGIGHAIVTSLAREGARVIAVDRQFSVDWPDWSVEQEVAHAPQQLQMDITDAAHIDKLTQLLDQKGNLDIFVNAAGITRNAPMGQVSFGYDLHEVMQVNLMAPINMLNALRPYLRRSTQGRVVLIGSTSGLHGNTGQMAYAASKGALGAVVKTAAKELAGRRGCTCNLVAPGLIKTEMANEMPEDVRELVTKLTPLKREGTPAEIADVVLFLCSANASYITGQVIEVDGGLYM